MSWYTVIGDCNGAGIYEWRVDGTPIYVGQSRRLDRRLADYARNISRMEAGRAYRLANPSGFRWVHQQLLEAKSSNRRVEFCILENCETVQLNQRERYYTSQRLRRSSLLDDVVNCSAASRQIVAATLRGESPPGEQVEIWLRGGAMFWDQEHWLVCWGLYLPKALDNELVESMGIREATRYAADCIRTKFGQIAIIGDDGTQVVAITRFNSFEGDTLLGFYPSVNAFLEEAKAQGWLLGQEPDLSDALEQVTDDQLHALYRPFS